MLNFNFDDAIDFESAQITQKITKAIVDHIGDGYEDFTKWRIRESIDELNGIADKIRDYHQYAFNLLEDKSDKNKDKYEFSAYWTFVRCADRYIKSLDSVLTPENLKADFEANKKFINLIYETVGKEICNKGYVNGYKDFFNR